MTKKEEVQNRVDIIAGFLKTNKYSLWLETRSAAKGKLYFIYYGTQEQCNNQTGISLMKSGNANEILCYLQGMRDFRMNLIPDIGEFNSIHPKVN